MNKQIILDTREDYDIIIQSINEELMDKINIAIEQNRFNDDNLKENIDKDFNIDIINTSIPCKISDIYLIGDIKEISSSTLHNLIPRINQYEYKCYVSNHKHQTPIHESVKCSYNCALQALNNPKYAIIYKRDKCTQNGINKLIQEKGLIPDYTKPVFKLDCKIIDED